MQTRPKIKVEPSAVDKVLDMVAILMVVILWALALYHFSKLPDTIAIHFDSAGNVNGHGSNASLFILPVIGTGLFFLLFILNKYPHMFNYPIVITDENARRQYLLATRLLRLLNAGILLSLTVTLYGIVNIQGEGSIGAWILPMILIITTLPIVWYFVAARKAA